MWWNTYFFILEFFMNDSKNTWWNYMPIYSWEYLSTVEFLFTNSVVLTLILFNLQIYLMTGIIIYAIVAGKVLILYTYDENPYKSFNDTVFRIAYLFLICLTAISVTYVKMEGGILG
jgi:hypothetical protein